LSFVEKIKSPEILFKKDSTIVYVFLKKKSSNSFDGLLGFSNAESTKISLNGYVNLKLDNIFDRGNTFQFNWQKDSQNRNELQLKAYTPYMYNSILSNTANFTLLKKDSTYLNTSFKEHLILPFKNNHNIYLLYNFQSSIVLLKDAVYNVQDYKRNLFGIGYSYKKPSIYLFEPYLFGVDVSYVFGNRSTKNYNQKQKEINFTSFYNFKVSKKIVLATKLIFKGLFSDDLLDNELYLLGGNETLRGYKNLSVSADKYSILHVDLNFYPNNYSKFYILSDYGVLSFIRKSNKIMSFGLGYSYKVAKNNQLDINYVLSKENNNSFKNAVLGIGFITYF
jgi:hemolysin activation/secretion protein